MELSGLVFIQVKNNAATWHKIGTTRTKPIDDKSLRKKNYSSTEIDPKICQTNLIMNYHVVAVGTTNKVPFVYEEICHKYYLWNVFSSTYLKLLQNNV